MKQVLLRTFAVALLALFVLTVNTTAKQIKEANIKIAEMCAACKDKVDTELKGLDGVISSKINLKSKTINVKYDSDITNPDKIKTTINGVCTSVMGNKTGDQKCGDNTQKNSGCSKAKTPGCCSKSQAKTSGCCSKSKTTDAQKTTESEIK